MKYAENGDAGWVPHLTLDDTVRESKEVIVYAQFLEGSSRKKNDNQ